MATEGYEYIYIYDHMIIDVHLGIARVDGDSQHPAFTHAV